MAVKKALTDKSVKTALETAIISQDLDKIGSLLEEHPFSVNRYLKYKDGVWGGKCPPIFLAIAKADVHTVKLLIQRGADVNKPAHLHNNNGHQEKVTSFVYACRNGNLKVLPLLAMAGADIDSSVEVSRVGEEEGGLINYAEGTENTTCLHWATFAHKYKLVEELLNLGANPNLRSATGQTCLHYACEVFNPMLIRMIVKAGGVSSHPDMFQITPLCNVVTYSKSSNEEIVELIKLLLYAGYDTSTEAWLTSGRLALAAGKTEEALCQNMNDTDLHELPYTELTRLGVRKRFGVDVLLWMILWPTVTKTLKFYSRLTIRTAIGSQALREKLAKLNLPHLLHKYVDLDEL